MKRILSIFLLVICLLTDNVFAQNNPQDAIVGVWLTADKDGKVQIYKQGEKYFGKIIWGKVPKKDTENPDVKLRTRDLIGVVILNKFKFNGKSWEDGTIYDPLSGKTYSCTIKTKGPNNLDIRGYLGISLLGRTTNWTKITL